MTLTARRVMLGITVTGIIHSGTALLIVINIVVCGRERVNVGMTSASAVDVRSGNAQSIVDDDSLQYRRAYLSTVGNVFSTVPRLPVERGRARILHSCDVSHERSVVKRERGSCEVNLVRP
ncbi:hypothetical protein WOLCODRAFT_155025 [Wolfiporia cocos MD-104 SS10]|uniref:Uncharacterized protein n=1 Tax=Wolfiporia cocos (strain MD-104) TaxID=742152 RepID=A0A2H3JTW6_WOLCO|nr:hypothetical protein WOLCODRAFT_155025 [Wolfiporia cocos MD-104 SS10]